MSIQLNPDAFIAVKTRKVTPTLTGETMFSTVMARRNARFERRSIRAF